jgi:hypothetical protein
MDEIQVLYELLSHAKLVSRKMAAQALAQGIHKIQASVPDELTRLVTL